MMDQATIDALQDAVKGGGHITVMTGAGISAESGIPTFRGPEGYWTVGSREFHPQEMATHTMFCRFPEAVWQWYLYRMDTCRRAEPNAGHHALVSMEKLLAGRFTLITQNVDGLHLRAGSRPETTYQNPRQRVLYPLCEAVHGGHFSPCPRGCPASRKTSR